MPISGYVDYQKREYCRDIKCPVQLKMNHHKEGSVEYERTRAECRKCMAWQFHHWLDGRGYVIVRKEG
ncbi:MAG: hypothetical protein V1744_00970 [Candidatus Altiarchaeota archaeon]